MLRIGLTKGRVEQQVLQRLEVCGFDVTLLRKKTRALRVRVDGYEFIFAKANDVMTFLEHGLIDVGIVGKDTLMEHPCTAYYEYCDLYLGQCSFAVASYPSYASTVFQRRKRIASKYVHVTKNYFHSKGEDVEIIKLEGSVELAPISGLADAIVDIVETGATLEANGLVVIEHVADVSVRCVVHRTSFRFQKEEIDMFIKYLLPVSQRCVEEGGSE